MVSVREEPDGLAPIGELIEAESTCWALRNLHEAEEGTDHADSKDHQAQPPTIAIAKQKHTDKERERREQ